ncbi:alpha/beta hydrolase family esterase [Viridibacterium curvum]|uniref:PHB depolymerase family esterase n=1 Tax=Viridibacterium curvum TaxID=1101404 RepID=A0ABP9QMQ3_9RHOO
MKPFRYALLPGLALVLVSLLANISTAEAGLLDRLRERRGERSTAQESIPTVPGDYSLKLEHAGQQRQYRLHIPASYKGDKVTPLVLAFHGGGGNMDIQADDRYYGLVAKSEQAGFIIAFPNGYSRLGGKLATWNAGHCCGAARDKDSDDVGFVRELLARLQAGLSIDERRIFATGISNGAMMSYRLACEMSGTFRAIAAVAGTDNTRSCTPDKAVSILHIHARDDELELFDGGAGRKSDKVTPFVAVPDSMAKWARLDGCRPVPERIFETPGAYCEAYSGCRDGSAVKLCVTDSGGHSWPGGQKPRGGADKPPSTAIRATDVIWQFFSER